MKVKMRYVAQLELTDEIELDAKDVLPLDEIQKNVQEILTPEIEKLLVDNYQTESSNATVTQMVADIWME